MYDDTLLVEDVLLVLLDDARGVPPRPAALPAVLGAAVAADLALLGRVRLDDPVTTGPAPRAAAHHLLYPTGTRAVEDPVLSAAQTTIASRIRPVGVLLPRIGRTVRTPVGTRLVARGLVRYADARVPLPFAPGRYPAADTRHKKALRDTLGAVLEDGEPPGTRTAALIALVTAAGGLGALHPTPRWTAPAHRRATELRHGHRWPAATAADRTAAALVGSGVAAVTPT